MLFIGISMILSCRTMKKDEPVAGDLYLDNPKAKMGRFFLWNIVRSAIREEKQVWALHLTINTFLVF